MKILCVANERSAAQLAANALHGISPDVRVAWAGSLSAALGWIPGNLDVAAVVVEAAVQNEDSASFVTRIRDVGLTAPVIVVTPDHGAPGATFDARSADYIVSSQSLLADLPGIVRREQERNQATRHR